MEGFIRRHDVPPPDTPPARFEFASFRAAADEFVKLATPVRGGSPGADWIARTAAVLRRLRGCDDPVQVSREIRQQLGAAPKEVTKKHTFGGENKAWELWKAYRDRLRDDLRAPSDRWMATRLVRLFPVVLALYEKVKARRRQLDQHGFRPAVYEFTRNIEQRRQKYCNKRMRPGRRQGRGEILQPLPGAYRCRFSGMAVPAMTDLSLCSTASHGRGARATFLLYPGARFAHPRLPYPAYPARPALTGMRAICYHTSMPALHVRDLDDALIAALKERARRNRRSLQGEVRTILEAAAVEGYPTGARTKRRLRLRTVRVGRPSNFSREVIYENDDR